MKLRRRRVCRTGMDGEAWLIWRSAVWYVASKRFGRTFWYLPHYFLELTLKFCEYFIWTEYGPLSRPASAHGNITTEEHAVGYELLVLAFGQPKTLSFLCHVTTVISLKWCKSDRLWE
jgi:hypothetical protein